MAHKQNQTRIVVIGAGYAGLRAALRLARKGRSLPIHVTLVNSADHFVQRVRMHQFAANQSVKNTNLPALLSDTGVDFVHGWVTALAPTQKLLTIKTASGVQQLAYDKLVYALGSYTDLSAVPGVADYALSLSTESTAQNLRARLPELAARGGRVVIVGGGLTGIESSTEIAESYPGLQVKLVTAGAFGRDLSAKGAAHVRAVFARHNVQLVDHARVNQVTPTTIETESGSLPYDLCLWAGSFTAPSLAHESGIAVNARGQIRVDDHLRSASHPDIYAIGDSAGLEDAVDVPVRMACATGLPMAAYAADQLIAEANGTSLNPYRFSYYFRCISLGRNDGLIQFVQHDDTPVERVLTGRAAARFKEMIVRFAAWQPGAERWMPIHIDDRTTQQRDASPVQPRRAEV